MRVGLWVGVCVFGGVGGIVIKHKLWKSEETGHVHVQP